jgi:hypothetical protein
LEQKNARLPLSPNQSKEHKATPVCSLPGEYNSPSSSEVPSSFSIFLRAVMTPFCTFSHRQTSFTFINHNKVINNTKQQEMCIPTTTSTATSGKCLTRPGIQEINQLVKRIGMKRPRQQVRFAQASTILAVQDEISSEEHFARWYQATDLAYFKIQAKDHITSRDNRSSSNSQGCSPVDDEEETTSRGYERYTIERSQNKAVAVKCTLIACRKGLNAEAISLVARKGSEWFERCAFAQACEDYCDAYQPQLKHLLPKQPSCNSPFAKFLQKRHRSGLEQTEDGQQQAQYHQPSKRQRATVTF